MKAVRVHNRGMAAEPRLRHCPNCSALYHVVRVRALFSTETPPAISCINWRGGLDGRDGSYLLKWFHLRPRERTRGSTGRHRI